MSHVVFVGNVPYNIGEDALVQVFKTVGHVVALRLVYDRETEKPKGYGFCEFADHATAASAVRNLHGYSVNGRPLRIDLADSDPFLEGKTTVRGEIVDGGESRGRGASDGSDILASVPPGKPLLPGETAENAITTFISTRLDPKEALEILAQLKAFTFTHPKQALVFLRHNPQVAYAAFMGMCLSNMIPADVLETMRAQAEQRGRKPQNGNALPSSGPPAGYGSGGPPASFPLQRQSYPGPSAGYPPPAGPSRPPSQSMPPPAPMYGHPGMPPQPTPLPPQSYMMQQQQQPQQQGYYNRPPAMARPTPPPPPPMPGYGAPPPAAHMMQPQAPPGPAGYGQPPPPVQSQAEMQQTIAALAHLSPEQLSSLSEADRRLIEQLTASQR
ncbi:RRM domain-containing protein [Mycena kentingensis (nom. inval.)]|nr:RRM domain-containing protein [Mycena kentingensis (nom. inval.)]